MRRSAHAARAVQAAARVFSAAAAIAAAAALAVTPAWAVGKPGCVCGELPLSQRLDDADAAVVGRVVAAEERDLRGARVRLLTVEVDQRVKGWGLGDPLLVRSPAGTDCDLEAPERQAVGLLLQRAPDGTWLGSACSLVGPGELVAAGGEPRGGPIKVAIGLALLALVLVWSFARLRRGVRPELPGGPEA